MKNEIILQAISIKELEEIIRNLVRTEFESMNQEMQRVLGEDDLVSTGTACRILGMSTKVLKVLVDEGYFTVYYHMKEKRYCRGELLNYRNQYRVHKKRG